MSFPSSHGLSVFTNACHTSPGSGSRKKRPKTAPLKKNSPTLVRDSLTGKSSHAVEISKQRRQAAGERKTSFDPTTTQGASPPSLANGELTTVGITSSVKPPSKYSTLFQTLIETNSLLQQEVRKLKREHRIAMAKLTHLESSRRLNESHTESEYRLLSQSLPPSMFARRSSDDSGSNGGGSVHDGRPDTDNVHNTNDADRQEYHEEPSGYRTPEEFLSDNENRSEHDSDCESYQMAYMSLSSGEESAGEQYASPGMLAVERMWDNFTVNPPGGTQQAKKEKKEWLPRKVTIPKPFSMTIRDANQIKKKSRSLLAAEKESEERLASEVAETRKKFRANPIPVHTYLPLYQLTNAKNEQRKEMMRKMVRGTTLKPFNFQARDELRQKQREEMKKEEEKKLRKQTEFKAKPIPLHMFSSQVEESAMEKETYRKIRNQMRAAKLLAEAKAPYSMRLASHSSLVSKSSSASVKSKDTRTTRSQASYTYDCSFHPKITRRLPDYNKVYNKFQQELKKKKQSKLTTVSEPFLLHTEKRAMVKKNVAGSRPVQIPPAQKLKKCQSTPSPSPYTPHMTETVRRRQVLTQQRLEEAGQKEIKAEEEENVRKLRSKAMQKLVAEKASMMDLGGIMEEKKKYKMLQFKERDRSNQEKYKRHLKDIKKRVESRPLLLEQAAGSLNSIGEAKANYIAALRKVGFSEEEIETLLQDVAAECAH